MGPCMVFLAGNQALLQVSHIRKQTRTLASPGHTSTCLSILSTPKSTFLVPRWSLQARRRTRSVLISLHSWIHDATESEVHVCIRRHSDGPELPGSSAFFFALLVCAY